jgi:hypothetical protein
MECASFSTHRLDKPVRRFIRSSFALLVGVCLPLCVLGCVNLEVVKQKCGFVPAGPESGRITQVYALWADGIVVQPDPELNGTPWPGIAGRVYLLGPTDGNPLKADGIMTVSLYDDLQDDHSKPREQWNIDSLTLQTCVKKDVAGWGYNLWLPWRTFHPMVKRVELRVQYTPVDGSPAWSNPAPIVLKQGPSVVSQERTSVRGTPTPRREGHAPSHAQQP